MPNVENINVAESMNKADREINKSVDDIAREDKIKIAGLETTIKETIDSKEYKAVREEYLKANKIYVKNENGYTGQIIDQAPETVLESIKRKYDTANRQNQEQGTLDLASATTEAKTRLEALAKELAQRTGYEKQKTREAGEEIGRMTGGDRLIAKPGGLKENMDQVEQMLGVEPRMKIEAFTTANDKLLTTLKQPANWSKYLTAKTTYGSLTDGLYLEDASKMLNENIQKTLVRLKDMPPEKVRAEMLKLVEKQLQMLTGLYRILVSALSSGPEKPKTVDKSEEKIPDSQKITDEDMAKIFDVIFESVRWSKDDGAAVKMPTTISEGLDTYYNVGKAYTFYTGRTSDQVGHFDNVVLDYTVGTVEAATLGTLKGGVNALVGVSKLGVDTIDTVTKLAASRVYGVDSGLKTFSETRDELGKKAGGLYAFLSELPQVVANNANFESLKMLGRFLVSGFQNTSQAERVMLINQIVSEFVVGEIAGGKILEALGSKGLGHISSKLAALSSMPGVSTMLKVSNFIIKKCPSLKKYGTKADDIIQGLRGVGQASVEIWDVFLDKQDLVGDAQGVYSSTLGMVPDAASKISADKLKISPVYKDMMDARRDISEALQYSKELGLDNAAVSYLKIDLAKIEERLGAVKD